MRHGQGQFTAALAVLALLSVAWLLLSLNGIGIGPDTGSPPPLLAMVASGRGADRALLELSLERYAALARNMSSRIATAEQALRQLQQRQGATLAPKVHRAPSGQPFQPDSPPAEPPAEGGGAAAAEGGAAAGEADAEGHAEGAEQSGWVEDEETEEEREKRQKAEEKEQHELIGYDAATKEFKQRWRPDFKCGDRVPALPDNEVVECDPGSETPCCSSLGWCGKSKMHCTCELCVDYSSKVKVRLVDIRVEAEERECADIAYSFGPLDSPKACAELVLQQAECGRLLMFSHTYPSWGCRCCAGGTLPAEEVKPDWTVYRLDVVVEPKEGSGDGNGGT